MRRLIVFLAVFAFVFGVAGAGQANACLPDDPGYVFC